jgi:hypothetical protein
VLEVKKKRIMKRYLARGEAPPDLKNVELSSGDESCVDSAVSDGGINEKDVDFVNNDDVLRQIENRRKFRRQMKAKNQIEFMAIQSVIQQLSKFEKLTGSDT